MTGRAVFMHKSSAIYATYCRPICHRHCLAVWSWRDWTTATRYSMARQSTASISCSVCRTMQPESSSRHRGGPTPDYCCINYAGCWFNTELTTKKVSLLTYKTLNTSVPRYISQRIDRRINAWTLRSMATPLLIQPFARTDFETFF